MLFCHSARPCTSFLAARKITKTEMDMNKMSELTEGRAIFFDFDAENKFVWPRAVSE